MKHELLPFSRHGLTDGPHNVSTVVVGFNQLLDLLRHLHRHLVSFLHITSTYIHMMRHDLCALYHITNLEKPHKHIHSVFAEPTHFVWELLQVWPVHECTLFGNCCGSTFYRLDALHVIRPTNCTDDNTHIDLHTSFQPATNVSKSLFGNSTSNNNLLCLSH